MIAPRRALIGLAAALFAPAKRSVAHHGFGGRYDVTSPIWLEGVVRRAGFVAPHPVLTLQVDAEVEAPPGLPGLDGPLAARPEDRGALREVEFPPVAAFFGLRGRAVPGERVAVVALRNCLPPHQLRSQWLRLASGEVVSRGGRLSYMVEGCG